TYYHNDDNGSTRALTDWTGTVIGTASYDGLGNITTSTGSATPFGYASEYRDSETGLLFAASGYYDPSTGQSVGSSSHVSDPIPRKGGGNRAPSNLEFHPYVGQSDDGSIHLNIGVGDWY